MPTYAATLPGRPLQLQNAGRSSNLDAGSAAFGTAWVASGFKGGPRTVQVGAQVAGMNRAGVAAAEFGRCYFDRVLVLPRLMDAKFVLSDQVWPVEVWNAHRQAAVQLTGLSVTGVGNLVVAGPSSMTFNPGQSQVYTATLPGQGDAMIDALATWSFAGESGADLTVMGSRITVFPHRPDWTEPFLDRLAWLTEVLPGYDTTEQRRALRSRPRHSVSYRVLTTSPLEAASLEGLLFSWQARQFGVPIWPESSPLLADLAPGAWSIPADMTDRGSVEVGGLVMLWSDFGTWEAFQVASLGPGAIGLGSQVTKTWTAGARVVPVRRGRLQPEQALGRPANWITAGAFTFDCEAV